MSTALAMFDPNAGKFEAPAHVAKFVEKHGSNIAERTTVPTLGLKGKVWSISLNGEETKLMKVDAETGDKVPVAILKAVILAYAPRRGRAYYEGAYNPDATGKPTCWSDDGYVPHPTVTDKKAAKCEACPLSIKGSKVTDNGKEVAACGQHRMVAVAPVIGGKIGAIPALRLKLAITSDWDGNSPDLEKENWFGFSNMVDFVRAKGVTNTAVMTVKMKFDQNAEYPKVIFQPDNWLSAEDLALVEKMVVSDEVKQLLGGTWTPNGADGTAITHQPAEDDGSAQAAADAVRKAEMQAKIDADKAAKKAEAKAKAKAEEEAKAKAAAEAQAATSAIIITDDDDVVLEGTVTAKTVAEPAAATAKPGVPDDVKALLTEWNE